MTGHSRVTVGGQGQSQGQRQKQQGGEGEDELESKLPKLTCLL